MSINIYDLIIYFFKLFVIKSILILREILYKYINDFMIEEIISESPEETIKWAEDIGRSARRGNIYALSGELGSGKTIIAKGIARGMGIKEDITSPTFLFVEIYDNISCNCSCDNCSCAGLFPVVRA